MIGRVAALNKFIFRATDKCMPFFKVLKKAFQWNDECEQALTKLKEVLDETASTRSLSDGREVVPLLSSIYYYSKFNTNQRRRECS